MLVDRALALGAGAERGLAAEVDRLAVGLRLGVVAEVEFELPVAEPVVAHQTQLGGERPAGLRAKALERADALVAQEGLGLGDLEGAPGRGLGDAEAAAFAAVGRAGAGVAAVVLADHAAAVRARRGQRRVVARDGVAVVLLGLPDDALGHLRDLGHEGLARQPAMLHLREPVFPVAGQLGLGQVLDAQAAQQGHQLEGLGRRHQFAALAQQVLLGEQALDDRRARGRRAQALLGHRLAQLVVVDQLARALHRAEQRGLGIARRRARPEGHDVDGLGAHDLAGGHRHQVGVLLLRLLAVDGEPAGDDQHLAVGLERIRLATLRHGAGARGHEVFGARVEHGKEALDDHVVEPGLGLAQRARHLERRNDREVVRDLGVVEHPLDRLDVALPERLARVRRQRTQGAGQVGAGDRLEGPGHDGEVVLGQVARVGARVGQQLVLLVERLRQRERGLGRVAEARVGLALQRGQVVEQRAGLRAGLGLLDHGGRLAAAGLGDGLRAGLVPETVGARVGVVAALERRVEPLALVAAGLRVEAGLDLPVRPRDMAADLLLALDDDRQRRRLHAPDGGQEEAAVARVERRHRPRAVDADQPVGLAAAARGRRQALHLAVLAQALEALADGLRRHALQPQPAHRLVDGLPAGAGVVDDQAKDQLALAPGVAGVDDVADVLAPDLPDHGIEPGLGLVDRREVEVRRDHRQVREAPLAALDVVGLGGLDLDEVADGRGHDVARVLVVLVVLVELAGHGGQRAHDVLRDAGLLGDDEGLAHGPIKAGPRGLQPAWLTKGFRGRRPCLQSRRSRAHARARPWIQCTE